MNKRYLFIFNLLLLSLCSMAQTSKLSSYVRRAVMQERVALGKAKAAGKKHRVTAMTAFVRATDADLLRREGCRIYAQWDDIYIASVPVDKISSLARMPQIQRIEADESCFITNDTTAVITRAKDLWNGSVVPAGLGATGLKGKGVVVGVMDIGFDLTHPTFYSADMQEYRIKALWDQLDFTEGGQPVVGDRDTIYVGRQYVGKDALLAKQYAVDGLTQTHGTHTAGTAAGSGAPMLVGDGMPVYGGMAPEADLCLVANYAGDNKDLVPEDLRRLYTTATDMLGFKYIFDYAESVGKPCVINFSEGAHDDLYEHALYQEVLSKLVGPGRIICASAGNEGGHGSYVHKSAGVERRGAFLSAYSPNALYVMSSDEPVKLQLSFYHKGEKKDEWTFDAECLRDYPDSVYIDNVYLPTDSFRIYINTYPSCVSSSKFATDMLVSCLSGKNLDRSDVAMSMALLGVNNDIEAYNAGGFFVSDNADKSLADFTYDHNILFPASIENVICVGNVGFRTSYVNYEGNTIKRYDQSMVDGKKSRNSSVGPTIDGIVKPDVMAPGINVISAYNSFYHEHHPGNMLEVSMFRNNDREYSWGEISGTSMSSPVVAGIVALWLQACPTLSPEQIRQVFASSCTPYGVQMSYPNNEYGWGIVNAEEGLRYTLSHYVGIDEIENDGMDGAERIYTLSGMLVNRAKAGHGVYIISNGKKTKKVIL